MNRVVLIQSLGIQRMQGFAKRFLSRLKEQAFLGVTSGPRSFIQSL